MDISNVINNTVSNISAGINQTAGMSALKASINIEAQTQMELVQMMKELTPYLGQNIDITV